MEIANILGFGNGPDMLILLLFAILPIFWVVQLIDVLRRRFPDSGTKVSWSVAVIFLPVIGAIIYAFAGRRHGQIGA